MKKIAILGSTGSIGTQTLEIVRNNADLSVVALAAGRNVELMEKQIREFAPKFAVMWSKEAAEDLRARIKDTDVKVASGMEGLIEAATLPEAEVLVTAIVGMIGIRPTIAAINAGKDHSPCQQGNTGNCAGHIIMPLIEEKKVPLLPVDSEHSAIFQSLHGTAEGKTGKDFTDCLRRTFPGKEERGTGKHKTRGCLKAPQLVHGTENHHRLLHTGQ